MTPTEMRRRMAAIDREVNATRSECTAAVLDKREALGTTHRALWHRLYTMGEDPPRRSNGWGDR